MIETLTLENFLNFSQEIVDTTKKYDTVSEILSLKICSQYDTKDLSSKVNYLFVKFKNIKYFYNFSIESSIKLISPYQQNEGQIQLTGKSKIENAVTKKYDGMIWAKEFYNTIIFTCKKLTNQEALYISNALVKNISDSDVAELLGVCTKTVQHIKKSCLIKLWSELEPLYSQDNN